MAFWTRTIKDDDLGRPRAEWINSAIDAGFTVRQAEYLFDAIKGAEKVASNAAMGSAVAVGLAAGAGTRSC